MKLLIDIGNTRLKWVFAGGEDVSNHVEIETQGLTESSLLAALEQDIEPQSIWISSVADDETVTDLCAWLAQLWGAPIHIAVVSGQAAGLRNGYRDQQQLGVDRWVAAIGARQLRPQGNLIVIDAGTAITIDLVTADNVYQGGTILPGPGLMHDALVSKTAGIESALAAVNKIVGKTTTECVNSGVIYGLVGAIDRIIDEIAMTLDQQNSTTPGKPSILITGGEAELLVPRLRAAPTRVNNLVLTGLQRIAREGELSDAPMQDANTDGQRG